MENKLKRWSVVWATLTLLVSLFVAPVNSFAADMTNIQAGTWTSTWHLKMFNNMAWTEEGIWMKKVDNQIAFCVEHGVPLEMQGSDYNPSAYESALKDRLALIAYYGYQQNPTNYNYGVTQMLIWETLGDELLTNDLPDYQAQKQAILSKVDAFNAAPSFTDQTIT